MSYSIIIKKVTSYPNPTRIVVSSAVQYYPHPSCHTVIQKSSPKKLPTSYL